jgi:hypothetical protein
LLERSKSIAEQVWRSRGRGKDPRHDVIGGSLQDTMVRYDHTVLWPEAGRLKDHVLAARRRVADGLTGPTIRPEVLTTEVVDRCLGNGRMRSSGWWRFPTVVHRWVDLNDGAVVVQHRSHDLSNLWSIHPVKGLSEGNHPEPAKAGRQLLRSSLNPGGVRDVQLVSGPARLGEHVSVGINSDHSIKEASEAEGDHAWATADIEEPTVAIEP